MRFIETNIIGKKVKIILENNQKITIESGKKYILIEKAEVDVNYKVFYGNFPIELSLYKSESFKKHKFLINSINRKIITDQFLILYKNNITNLENNVEKNINMYKKRIEDKTKIIKISSKPIKNNLNLAFIKNIGHFIINYIAVYIGEQKIDYHTGEWLDIYSNLLRDDNKQYDKMIGNINKLIKYDTSPKGNYRLYIPLRFWFSNITGLALPLISLHNNSVKIELLINDLEKCLKFDSRGTIHQEGELEVKLLTEYYYLSDNERKLFAESKHEYLIEKMQISNGDIINSKQNEININFNDPIKDLIWTIKPNINIENKDYDKYCLTEEKITYDYYQNDYIVNKKEYLDLVSKNTEYDLIPNSFKEIYDIFKNFGYY